MPDHILVMMIFAGAALFTIGQIGLVITSFIAGLGWGLVYVFLPVIGFILNVYYRWAQAKVHFCLVVFGLLIITLALFGAARDPKSQVSVAIERFTSYGGVYNDVSRVQKLTHDLTLIMRKEKLRRPLTLNRNEARRIEEYAQEKKSGPKVGSLFDAVRTGDSKLVEEWAKKDKARINSLGLSGTTPLMEAAAFGHKEIVEILIANGADPGIVNPENKTALVFAEENLRESIADVLRAHAAGPAS